MAERLARPILHRNPTSEGSFQDEHSRARQPTSDSRRQRSTSTRTSSPEGPLFACPYSKHDPERYSHKNVEEQDYRNCSSGYFMSIPRLKQHLYRTHDRSQRCCTRCWLNFPNDDALRRHVETMDCQKREMPEEKMDEEQYLKMKERTQGRPYESWYTIYRILFPEDDLPPTPYAEWVIGLDLRACFTMLAKRLPVLLYQAATRDTPQAGKAQLGLQTPFPTRPDIIQRALRLLQTEFGQATNLSHVFATDPPSFGSTARSVPGRTLQSSPRSQARRLAAEMDEQDDSPSAISYQEAAMRGRPIAPQQRYVTQAVNVQPIYSTAPYTTGAYYPGTTAPMSGPMYSAMNMPEDMYEDYEMDEDEY